MPTGYTARLYEDKPTSFAEFVATCAHAFFYDSMTDSGQLPQVRDDDPGRHHREELAKAKAAQKKLNTMTDAQIRKAADDEYEERCAAEQKSYEDTEAKRERYEAMLDQVKAWKPPTAKHANLKKFMVEQLESSIQFDCHPLDVVDPKTPEQWVAAQQKSINWRLEYHAEELEKELERDAANREWIDALADSLGLAHV